VFERRREEIADTKLEMEEKYKEQLENLELKERTLNDYIAHQWLEIDENLKKERVDLQRKLQLHQHELEMEMEQKQARKARELEDKENELNKNTDFVENELKHEIELNESKIQKILMEKRELQAE
jgi:hypothetical protein